MSGLKTVTIDTPSARILLAALGDVRRLERAIFRSQSTHGVGAPSNRRERTYANLDKAKAHYSLCYRRVFEEEALAMVRLIRINPKLPPTATQQQFRGASRRIGNLAREHAARVIDEAGFPLPETLGVETAWTRQRADEQFRKRRQQGM